MQDTEGNFYGTTILGGVNNLGTVFKVSTAGALATVYSFCSTPGCMDGANPRAGLVLGLDGNFYGTNSAGGGFGWGTAFKITPGGALTTLYSFCSQAGCTDGAYPVGAVIQASNGHFYGTTEGNQTNSQGTIFHITPDLHLTTLHNFCASAGCPDGAGPTGALIQASDGNLYGTTAAGGASYCYFVGPSGDNIPGCGTVFKISPSGAFSTFYAFNKSGNTSGTPPDGYGPLAGLVQGADGNLYGATAYGGIYSGGTIFKMTTGGVLTTIYSFCSAGACSDGNSPRAALIQGTDGNFYGSTLYGNDFYSTLFELTPAGVLTQLHSFNFTDGLGPGMMVQGTDGNFYGTTQNAGSGSAGTVFKLSTGLGPFVRILPAYGKAGATVTILGTNLTHAVRMSFNGTVAAFTVVSASEITATVPAGATTGRIRVTLAGGAALISNAAFRVLSSAGASF